MGILEIAPDELNRQKEDGFTGLHVAVSNKRTEVVRFLISKCDKVWIGVPSLCQCAYVIYDSLL